MVSTTDEHARVITERLENRVTKETVEVYNMAFLAWQLVLQTLGRMTSILITAGLASLIPSICLECEIGCATISHVASVQNAGSVNLVSTGSFWTKGKARQRASSPLCFHVGSTERMTDASVSDY
jgi:hypothetical protein